MKILNDYPPNFKAIDAAFRTFGKPVIYAFGGFIYNPTHMTIPPELMAHETVHGQRQGDNPLGWWEQYLGDMNFRIVEELLAHRAEYTYLAERGNRHQRRSALLRTARRLAGPLYGEMMTKKQAGVLLKRADVMLKEKGVIG
jgi:hypothetical protein